MNRIETTPRGFPFDELSLFELQNQTVPVLNAIAKFIPDNSIVYGCDYNFSNSFYNEGFIIWNGEFMPFKGGMLNPQFSIIEEVIERTFNVGTDQDPQLEDHPAYIKRYAMMGNIAGAESVENMTSLKRKPRFLTYLRKGRRFIGTVSPNYLQTVDGEGTFIEVTFPSLGTSNYMILGHFYRSNALLGGNFDYDLFEKTSTSFRIRIKNLTEPLTGLIFDYLITSSNTSLQTLEP